VLAPKVIRFLYDPTYAAAEDALRLLYVAAVFSYLTSFLAYVLIALDRQRDALGVNALVLAANVALNLYAIPRWGMLGAAWCMLATETLSVALTVSLVRLRCGFSPGLGALPRVLLAAGVMGAALWWLAGQGLRLLALAPIGIALYAALALLFRLVDRETLADILRLKDRSPLAARRSLLETRDNSNAERVATALGSEQRAASREPERSDPW
jgi:O-antigen/teichoic acid export membrane protein